MTARRAHPVDRRAFGGLVLLALMAAAALALWLTGGLAQAAYWAAEGQRSFQNAMAGDLRGLKTGQAGALIGLLGLCFGYGFFHAAGPGHGKVLIGGYGAGSGVRLWPLVWISLASSMAQATTAVVLVYSGVLLFEWSREQMVGLTEAVLAPVSCGAIFLIGLWLVWRGGRGLWRQRGAGGHHDALPHGHRHDHGSICGQCGHTHGPSVQEVAAVRTWRDALILISGVAVRPCSGALFLLIITWRMGIEAAGILGAYAMALGTASVVGAVAALSVLARGSVLEAGSRLGAVRALVPALELVAGGVVALVALQMVLPFL